MASDKESFEDDDGSEQGPASQPAVRVRAADQGGCIGWHGLSIGIARAGVVTRKLEKHPAC